ncbi:hypothetical protein ACA910_012846 [Epithemia clementina (nom. ined.)]
MQGKPGLMLVDFAKTKIWLKKRDEAMLSPAWEGRHMEETAKIVQAIENTLMSETLVTETMPTEEGIFQYSNDVLVVGNGSCGEPIELHEYAGDEVVSPQAKFNKIGICSMCHCRLNDGLDPQGKGTCKGAVFGFC